MSIRFVTLLIRKPITVANITELSQVFTLIHIRFKILQISRTEGIFRNPFNQNLEAFSSIAQFIWSSRFCAIKLKGFIKCFSCLYWAVQNPHATIERIVKLPEVLGVVWIINIRCNWTILFWTYKCPAKVGRHFLNNLYDIKAQIFKKITPSERNLSDYDF